MCWNFPTMKRPKWFNCLLWFSLYNRGVRLNFEGGTKNMCFARSCGNILECGNICLYLRFGSKLRHNRRGESDRVYNGRSRRPSTGREPGAGREGERPRFLWTKYEMTFNFQLWQRIAVGGSRNGILFRTIFTTDSGWHMLVFLIWQKYFSAKLQK